MTDSRGTLKNSGQHDQPSARCPVAQNTGAADPEIRLAVGNRLGNVDIRAALPDGDIQTSVAVEALLKGLIVACELKLMLPFELNRGGIDRCGRMCCRQHQRSRYDQSSQQGQIRTD
jgi:hypothetical protein